MKTLGINWFGSTDLFNWFNPLKNIDIAHGWKTAHTGIIEELLNPICEKFTEDKSPCWKAGRRRALTEGGGFNNQELIDKQKGFTWDTSLTNYKNEKVTYDVRDMPKWFEKNGEWKSFTVDGGTLGEGIFAKKYASTTAQFVKFEGPGTKGCVVISPGRSEPSAKYAETIHYFIQKGFSPVFSIDHVAQGRSNRVLKKEDSIIPDEYIEQAQHVASREQYIKAFNKFLDQVLAETSIPKEKKRFLACHSMGCAIALTHVIREHEEGKMSRFDAMAANAPLIQANTAPFPYPIATAIGEVMHFFGMGGWYAPTKDDTFEEGYGNDVFEGSSTTSLKRFLTQRDLCKDKRTTELGEDKHKGLCLHGLTANMAREFFKLYDEIRDFMDNADNNNLLTPTLIQTAGPSDGTDEYVQNKVTTEFKSKCLPDEINEVSPHKESRHNIWWEKDSIRDKALGETVAYFERIGALNKERQFAPKHSTAAHTTSTALASATMLLCSLLLGKSL